MRKIEISSFVHLLILDSLHNALKYDSLLENFNLQIETKQFEFQNNFSCSIYCRFQFKIHYKINKSGLS